LAKDIEHLFKLYEALKARSTNWRIKCANYSSEDKHKFIHSVVKEIEQVVAQLTDTKDFKHFWDIYLTVNNKMYKFFVTESRGLRKVEFVFSVPSVRISDGIVTFER